MKIHVRIIASLLLFIISSCEDIYYDFSQEEIDFISYNEGDEFNLLSHKSLDTLSFEITSKSIGYRKTGRYLDYRDYYWQTIDLQFNSDEFSKISYSKNDEECELVISIRYKGVFLFETYVFGNDYFENHVIDSMQVENVMYKKVYYFLDDNNNHDTLFYTRNKGVIKIIDSFTNDSYTLLE